MSQTSLFDKPALKLRKPIRLIELFAGIGAQAKALERIGANFERWFVCDFDRFAIASYNAVHGTDFAPSDITQIHASDLRIEDTEHFDYILTYSFPCTDLSKAGEQKGMARASGTRSGLLWEVERILKECETLPQVLLMENVPDVVGTKNINDFREWIHFLESLGYTSEGEILNAVDFNVPQHRERCFMVSWLGEYSYTFPSPIPKTRRLVDMLEEEVDEKFYVPDEKVQKLIDSQILKVERERERAAEPLESAGTDRSTAINGTWSLNAEKDGSSRTIPINTRNGAARTLTAHVAKMDNRKLDPQDKFAETGVMEFSMNSTEPCGKNRSELSADKTPVTVDTTQKS